jgi:hypothetical protein
MASDLSETSERLWIPIVGPVIWAVHFTLCYVTAALWCGRFASASGPGDVRLMIGVYTAIAMAGTTASFVQGLRRHRYQLPTRTHDDDTPEDRRHFLAFTTMLLAGISLLSVAYVAIAVMVVPPCS